MSKRTEQRHALGDMEIEKNITHETTRLYHKMQMAAFAIICSDIAQKVNYSRCCVNQLLWMNRNSSYSFISQIVNAFVVGIRLPT